MKEISLSQREEAEYVNPYQRVLTTVPRNHFQEATPS